MVRDPVCGMQVDAEKYKFTARYGGVDYYFCSDSCQQTFEKKPESYVETNIKGHDHSRNMGSMGGCGGGFGCGMGGGGWFRYVFLVLMLSFFLLRLLR